MCDNGFGESGCKGSPIQSKVSRYRAKESSIFIQCFGGVNVLREKIMMFHWFRWFVFMIVSVVVLYVHCDNMTDNRWVNPCSKLLKHQSYSRHLKVQKSNDVMLNDNDFHGSVAFGAQTVPRLCRLDESGRKNGKKVSDLNKQDKVVVITVCGCLLECLFIIWGGVNNGAHGSSCLQYTLLRVLSASAGNLKSAVAIVFERNL